MLIEIPQTCTRTRSPHTHTHTHLHEGARLLAELVVVAELHGDGLVTVQASQLHVGSVAHVERAEEVCRSDACGGNKYSTEINVVLGNKSLKKYINVVFSKTSF